MSNHRNHRRNEEARTEHGPRYESPNPGKGCNATHVAKSRSDWKKIKNRSFRRTGRVTHKYHGHRLSPQAREDLEAGIESAKTEPLVDLGSFAEYIGNANDDVFIFDETVELSEESISTIKKILEQAKQGPVPPGTQVFFGTPKRKE